MYKLRMNFGAYMSNIGIVERIRYAVTLPLQKEQFRRKTTNQKQLFNNKSLALVTDDDKVSHITRIVIPDYMLNTSRIPLNARKLSIIIQTNVATLNSFNLF